MPVTTDTMSMRGLCLVEIQKFWMRAWLPTYTLLFVSPMYLSHTSVILSRRALPRSFTHRYVYIQVAYGGHSPTHVSVPIEEHLVHSVFLCLAVLNRMHIAFGRVY
jgi:hypothetical protein